jgi:serine/threonine protein kinase
MPRAVAVGDVLRRRYRIVAEVGHGGTGTVFEAIDDYRLDLPTTDLRVAIKVLSTVEQQREFQHLQLLSHANIVRVHEFDRDGGIDFFTMEFLSGVPLGKLLTARNGTLLPRPYALAIIRDVGDALAYAHSRGIVHGDLNPQEIFITNDGEMRVLGFGASHALLEGRSPDVRDDVFAFSCVAYMLMSGRHPFPQHTALEARLRRLRPSRPAGLTGRQWQALRAGLHWERAKRPSDVGEWLESFGVHTAAARLPPLSAMLRTSPPRKRHLILKTAAAALLVVLIAAGYWVITDEVSPAHAEAGWDSRVKSALSGIGAALVRLMPARSLKPIVTEPAPIAADLPPPPTSPTPPTPPTPPISPAPRVAPAPPRTSATPAMRGAPIRVARAVGSAALPVAASAAPVASVPPPPATSKGAANVGPVRIEMAADTIDLPATETAAHVIVRRKGNARGDSRFTWWTESGTAKPGVDFVAVTPHSESFPDGGNTLTLNVPVTDTPRSQPKSFYVVIGPAETGASLGQRTLTMVTIAASH